jgi:hypothetical protein
MDDADRDRVFAARDAWRNAVAAYGDELDRYVAAGWPGAGPVADPEPLTPDAWKRLQELQAAEQAARRDLEELLASLRGER